jgi:hypothetical protein
MMLALKKGHVGHRIGAARAVRVLEYVFHDLSLQSS